jgi:DNA-directed RNA polymerase I and III subunit RPAC1
MFAGMLYLTYIQIFRENLQLNILSRPSETELVFELIHVDVSFANALRRILLAEVPTVAMEHVYIWNNSSLIHDEVLAHRFGLIPLQVDARMLDEWDVSNDEEAPTDRNTVVFKLSVECKRPKPQVGGDTKEEDDDNASDDDVVTARPDLAAAAVEAAASAKQKVQYPKDRPYTTHVYSSDLTWVPQGEQEQRFEHGIRPIHDDILIAKLRPGQSIELEAHGRRGIGKDHAKYSPVATASYRLMPKIEILEPVYDELAEELVHLYEPGVFELVPTTSSDPAGTERKVRVLNPYACTMSRNFMRDPRLAKAIRMSRIPDHFIFSIESVGMYAPGVLVAEALRILKGKCQRVMDLADQRTAVKMETD